ncbi:MAG: putative addiction module antidote protein, partial [Desulfovibrionaceae bacterium]|nr:putative addiction module antidote protein [Desulfovibrionaceae bacterium]
MRVDKASRPHETAVVEELRADPAFAAEYLRAALEEEEPGVLLIALRRLAKAYGVQRVAQEAGVNRESLYRALSAKGNPSIKTIRAVLKPMGLRLTVEPAAPVG